MNQLFLRGTVTEEKFGPPFIVQVIENERRIEMRVELHKPMMCAGAVRHHYALAWSAIKRFHQNPRPKVQPLLDGCDHSFAANRSIFRGNLSTNTHL
jgi:hypothetical protein